MIPFLILLFFFTYSFALFFINSFYLLALVLVFNIFIAIFLRVPLRPHLKFLKSSLFFVLFITLCNLVFNTPLSALRVGLRLFLVIDFTFLISHYFSTTRIRLAFRYLLSPLRLFHIDVDRLTLIIAIALAFIPILADEARLLKFSLKSKGFAFSLRNLFTRPHIYLITFLSNLFNRLDDLERSLLLKAY